MWWSNLQKQPLRRVVPFDPDMDKLYPFDLTEKNSTLKPEVIGDTEQFARYIDSTLKSHYCRYGIGGYGEHRTLYSRSTLFDTEGEPRRLHLGVDIWGQANTKVMTPLDGIVHSFAFNNRNGDYGATLILTHNVGGEGFHTLYGHLSLNSLKNLYEGRRFRGGDTIGEFGMRFENGNWPPHLHFQVILDLQDRVGDYPGVCRFSEKERWLDNCPDPDLLLHMNSFIEK